MNRRAEMAVCILIALGIAGPVCAQRQQLPQQAQPLAQTLDHANWQNLDLQRAPAAAGVPEEPPVADATLTITLANALERAKAMSPELETALTNVKIAAEGIVQTRAANLPAVSANSQYLYTEGNGTLAARFIANNGVHEYIAQGDVHETISVPLLIQYRRSVVLKALARDRAVIAQRGLVVTVVQSYSALVAADGKLKTVQETLDAAQQFLKTSQELEKGGEVAGADVVKARIQASDSQVALNNAQLAREEARISLALLLFQDINQKFEVVDDPGQMLLLPAFAEAQTDAQRDNPDVDAASRTERAAQRDVTAAWAAYLPSLTFDYIYGIDANQFATRSTTPEGKLIQNLGYSALASLTLPIFNWGATQSKVKEAEYRKQQASTALNYTRRKLTADLEQFYREAQVAKTDMDIRHEAADDAVESRKLTLLRYKGGEATALEVVDAEATVSLERNAYYDAEMRYATALANLATLTGTL
ncbi:MAG: TolC family protein [Candidatus Acidiferrales bacterium]